MSVTAYSRQSVRAEPFPSNNNSRQVLTFAEWCALNAFSRSTGRRVLAGPNPPDVIDLSPKRIGITIDANRRWQESRTRKQA